MMVKRESETTELDVTLDLVAALEMFAGAFGSEGTTIDSVESFGDRKIAISLSDGSQYRLTVARGER